MLVTDSYGAESRNTFKVTVKEKSLDNEAATSLMNNAKEQIRYGNREWGIGTTILYYLILTLQASSLLASPNIFPQGWEGGGGGGGFFCEPTPKIMY